MTKLTPPLANRHPKTIKHHDDVRVDEYYWLREKSNPATISYLETENKYTGDMMSDTADLREQLYIEMKARVCEDDMSAPLKIDDYYYYSRHQKSLEYPIFCRRRGNMEAEEEVILDQNQLAKGMKYCDLGSFVVSPDHQLLAYALDTDGSENYTIKIRNIASREDLSDKITKASEAFVWLNDSASIIYAANDQSMRPYEIRCHRLGNNTADQIIATEPDENYRLSLSQSKSRKYIFILYGNWVSTEWRYFPADGSDLIPKMVNPRELDHQYYLKHYGDYFYILTNYQAINYKLMRTKISDPDMSNWEEVIPHREDITLRDIDVTAEFLSVSELQTGITKLKIINLKTQEEHFIEFEEEVYHLDFGDNVDFDSTTLRFSYSSLTTPDTIYDYDMHSYERAVIKQDQVAGGYDSAQYTTKWLFATASDGTKIPISMVHKVGLKLDGSNPLLLYGYGAYGLYIEPSFSSNMISLLDRGFIWATAHVRGGGANGRKWYYAGKLFNKKNTFSDFIACADYLVAAKYTNPQRLAIWGGSAGGMLIGAVINQRPELFQAAIATVPFVDVLNTMSDPSIPLTINEYPEWGDPADKSAYENIRSYSPYENVTQQAYPHLLVEAGLNDPRVQYWEPAKWVAKLRTHSTSDNMLLLKTEMDYGHQGATGRYQYLHEVAFRYAFLLSTLK